jgi:hypothetical protein
MHAAPLALDDLVAGADATDPHERSPAAAGFRGRWRAAVILLVGGIDDVLAQTASVEILRRRHPRRKVRTDSDAR